MGVLVLISVCCSLIGGLTVLGLHMCAIMGRRPHSRHKSYHYIRFIYYNLLVIIGGLSQFMLGIYLSIRFGLGPYDQPVHVATYTIHFPIVSIVVGIVQTIMGLIGIYWNHRRPSLSQSRTTTTTTTTRTTKNNNNNNNNNIDDDNNNNDNSFMYVVGFTWIITTGLQFILQPSYSNDVKYNSEGATVACVYLGFFVMPTFLDYLVKITPIQPQPEYYGSYYKEDFVTKLFQMEPKTNHHNCKTTTTTTTTADPLTCPTNNEAVSKTRTSDEVTSVLVFTLKPSTAASSDKSNNNNVIHQTGGSGSG